MPQLLLAGASYRDRAVAALGATLGIALTALTGWLGGTHALVIAAPIGASAVLVFAVPASPLAQPWPVVGGNVISALVGTATLHLLGPTPLAAGVAVGGAILAMSLARALHPPGGGTALAALASGASWPLALWPVGVDALVLALAGMLFHRWSGHSYPHRAAPVAAAAGITAADLDRALEDAHEAYDIAPDDLLALYRGAEQHARARR